MILTSMARRRGDLRLAYASGALQVGQLRGATSWALACASAKSVRLPRSAPSAFLYASARRVGLLTS
jgi:hypothetical protein